MKLNDLKKNTKIFASVLAAVLSCTLVPTSVIEFHTNAESYYKEVSELAGIEFDSFKKLSDYVDSLNKVSYVEGIEPEISDFLLSSDKIYAPVGISTGDINKILITPTYIELYFDHNGVKMQFSYYYDPDIGKEKLDEAKLLGNSIKGKNTVYYYEMPYFGDYESYHVWKQDGKYFQLRIGGNSNDEYITLCNAVQHDIKKNVNSGGLQTINGKLYYVNSDGTYATGWQTIDGKKYYFKKDGTAVTKNTTISGVRYKFTADGVCKGKYTGISTRSGSKYYYKNGIMQTGWVTRKGKTYYFGSDGKMRTGIYQTDTAEYDLGYDGAWDGVTGKITVKPKTIGEYLELTDFANAASVEFRVGLKKFKTLENADKLFEMLSGSSDNSFEYGSEPSYDEMETPQNIYSNSSTDIFVRFKNEDGILIGGWYFSKDKKGNGYFFNYLRNFGAVLNSSDVYDMLKDAYNQ